MKTLHALILAGAILVLAGAILRAGAMVSSVPAVQQSQAEMMRFEKAYREVQEALQEDKAKKCAASVGKTLGTIDRNAPTQDAALYNKCMRPAESRGSLRVIWDQILEALK